MSSVEKVNLSGVNQFHFTAQTENNSESKETSVKKYFTAPNVILGSLATIGVLGMADVLICKGKHLNKLTGKGKELEEAVTRATTAETKLQGVEAKLEELLAKSGEDAKEIKALKEQLSKLPKVLDSQNANLDVMLKFCQKLYIECDDFGPEAVKYIRKQLSKTLNTAGFKLADIKPKDLNFERYYNVEKAAIENFDMTAPAIIKKDTGEVVMKGHYFIPESSV